MTWPILIAIVVVVGVGLALVLRARQRQVTDGVDSFRRQIDALSPEARRPVIDQVQKQTDEVDDGNDDEEHDEGGPDGT